MSRCAARLAKELKDFEDDPPPGVRIQVESDPEESRILWRGTVQGPEGSPYENGVFHVLLEFENDYPFKPPIVSFLTRIYHCNLTRIVSPCRLSCEWLYKIGQGWAPPQKVKQILLIIQDLMSHPFIDSFYDDQCPADATPGLCTSGVQIFVKKLDGSILTIECALTDLIVNLKAEIEAREGIRICEQQLIFVGKELQNPEPLSHYNIVNESTVHLVVRLGAAYLNNLLDEELTQLWKSDRATFEKTAQEWTRMYALNPALGPIVTIQAEHLRMGSAVTGVCLDGREIHVDFTDPKQELLGGIRASMAEELRVPPGSVQLILSLDTGEQRLLKEEDMQFPIATFF